MPPVSDADPPAQCAARTHLANRCNVWTTRAVDLRERSEFGYTGTVRSERLCGIRRTVARTSRIRLFSVEGWWAL